MRTQNKHAANQTHLRNSRRLVAVIGAGLMLAAGNSLDQAVAQTTTSVSTKTSGSSTFSQRLDSHELEAMPEGISIVPSKSEAGISGGGGMLGSNSKMLGRGIPLSKVIAFAYDVDAAKVVMPADGLSGKYDVTVNVADGGKEKLQAELKTQFGITAKRETRNSDVLVLGVQQPNAPGLKASQSQGGSTSGTTRVTSSSSVSSSSSSNSNSSANENRHSGNMNVKGQSIAALIKNLQSHFDKPIVDRTALTGKYDVTLEWSAASGSNASDAIKDALASQAGLSLTPSSEPMEVLVVEKK